MIYVQQYWSVSDLKLKPEHLTGSDTYKEQKALKDLGEQLTVAKLPIGILVYPYTI